MLEVTGLIMDIRGCPRETQEIATKMVERRVESRKKGDK
jgi:hypothetical protein